MRISDWSSDVCSSDLVHDAGGRRPLPPILQAAPKDVFNDVPHVRHLLFTRGGQRQDSIQAPDTVSLLVYALSRYDLLHAVDVAAGRASPEPMRHTTHVESTPPPTQRLTNPYTPATHRTTQFT